MSWWKRNIDIILILLIGFTLRFTISFTHSYSNDELSAVSRLRYSNFSELIAFGVQMDDMHPAGVQVFMKVWSTIAGKSEIGMRFPFVLAGTASIFVLFLIGKRWFNRKVGLLSSGLLAVLYFPIMNSEFARPYSIGLFVSLLVGLYFHKVMFNKEKKWTDAILLGVFFAAGMYTHYFAFLFVAFIGFTGLIFVNKANFKYYALSGVLGVLLFLPHYSITSYHLSVGGLQWLAPPESDWLLGFIYHAFNASWIVVACLIMTLAVGFYTNSDRPAFPKRNLLLLIIWFFGIYIVGHVLSYLSTPVLKYPVMLFAFPFLLVLISVIISKIPRNNSVLIGLMLICIGSTLLEKDLYGNGHYALFKEPGLKMAEWNEDFGANNIYTIYNLNNPNYINFYADEWGGDSLQFDWSTIEFDDDHKLRKVLMEREEEYCVIGFSSRLTLVNVFETVKEFYPVVVDFERYNNGSVFLMKKGPYEMPAQKDQLASFNNTGEWEFNEGQVHSNGHADSYNLNEANRYGPTFTFTTSDLPMVQRGYLKVELNVYATEKAFLTVNMTGTRNEESIQHRGENMWIGHDLDDMLIPNETSRAYYAFKIPPYILSTDVLKISLWNRGESQVYIEEFRIYYVENKWN